MRGMVAPPTLDDLHLGTSPQATTVRTTEAKSIVESAGGHAVEQRTWWGGPALTWPDHLVPERRLRHRFEIRYDNVPDLRALGKRLARSGPHDLVVWRPVVLSYVGDGVATRGWIPWRRAGDVVATPPTGRTFPQVGAVPTAELDDDDETELNVVVKPAADYEAGTPVAGEMWMDQAGQTWRLGQPPDAAARVFVTVVPVLSVLDDSAAGVDYTNRRLFTEPRHLVFVEGT